MSSKTSKKHVTKAAALSHAILPKRAIYTHSSIWFSILASPSQIGGSRNWTTLCAIWHASTLHHILTIICLVAHHVWTVWTKPRSWKVGQGVLHKIVVEWRSAFVQRLGLRPWCTAFAQCSAETVRQRCAFCQSQVVMLNNECRKLTQHLPYSLVMEKLSKHFGRQIGVRFVIHDLLSILISRHPQRTQTRIHLSQLSHSRCWSRMISL